MSVYPYQTNLLKEKSTVTIKSEIKFLKSEPLIRSNT